MNPIYVITRVKLVDKNRETFRATHEGVRM